MVIQGKWSNTWVDDEVLMTATSVSKKDKCVATCASRQQDWWCGWKNSTGMQPLTQFRFPFQDGFVVLFIIADSLLSIGDRDTLIADEVFQRVIDMWFRCESRSWNLHEYSGAFVRYLCRHQQPLGLESRRCKPTLTFFIDRCSYSRWYITTTTMAAWRPKPTRGENSLIFCQFVDERAFRLSFAVSERRRCRLILTDD